MIVSTYEYPYQVEYDQLLQEIDLEIRSTAKETGISHLSSKVLNAVRQVPRHLFVNSQDMENAYLNTALPIGEGQTISQPFIVALMTELLHLHPNDKVLEIGTGSGYQAAILSGLVKEVYTLEFFPRLTEHAKEKFHKFGYDNIHAFTGDGSKGLGQYAPYDKIIVTAAAETIPPALIEELAPEGIMVIPLGPQGETQVLTVVTKDKAGQIKIKPVLGVAFVPFIHGIAA